MRIQHLIDSIDPAHGGPTAVVLCLAAAQAKLGHDVRIISQTPSHSDDLKEEFAQLGLSQDQWVRADRGVLRRLVNHTDFLHIHGVWETLLIQGASIARKRGIDYTVTPHGMLDPWCLQQRALKKKLALLLGRRRMINGAAFLHVLNRDEGTLMKPLGLTARPITIPNGVFLEEIERRPMPGRFRATTPGLGDRPFVLFLSRLHHKKGLDYLADAFKYVVESCDDVLLVVAGPDDGERLPFERRLAQLDLTERVILTGPLYGRAKFEAMVDASCFCLPSRQEGFSIAITEALACGLPVVISENCHFAEVAEVKAGHICPLSAEAVGTAILELLTDHTKAIAMGRAGRELVKSRFTWPEIAKRSIEAYRGTL